jgi:hypothetical protein
VGFCECGNESSVLNKEYNPSVPPAIDNERRIFPTSIYIVCHVLWRERSTYCVYWLCAYVSKRRLDETSDVCDQSTHNRITHLLDSHEMLYKYIT